jgi:hypothetical protein
MTDKTKDPKAEHTELRPHDVEAMAAAKIAEAKRAAPDPFPKTASDDEIDDLFNDMPV